MVKIPGHPRFSWLRKRYLFNIYLLLGSVSIVVATTIFTIRVSKSVERQSYLTTELFSDLASRLLWVICGLAAVFLAGAATEGCPCG